MNPIEYRFSLDMQSTCAQKVIPMKYGDSGHKLFITLAQNGQPYIIAEGCYAVFSAKKPDGNAILNHCAIADNAIEITYEITEQTTAAIGILPCEIMLYSADNRLITSPSFVIIVESTLYKAGTLASSSEFTIIAQLMDEVRSIKTEVLAVKDEILELTRGMTRIRYATVDLLADDWLGTQSPYAQIVYLDGVTANSKVDLQPSVEQLEIFHDKDLAFVAENEDGTVTIYAVGDKPAHDYTIQATITEVKV